MEKGKDRDDSSVQILIAALKIERVIGFTKTVDISHFENHSAKFQTDTSNQIAYLLKNQSGSKSVFAEVEATC